MSEKDHRLDDYFVQHKDIVFRNLLRLVDYHTAEDLCQETFIRLALKLEELGEEPDEEGLIAWLLVVSDHLGRDHLKKGGRIRTFLGLRLKEIDGLDFRQDPALIAEEHEESRKRMRVLQRLKEEKQDWYDALMMRYVGCMSDKEISRQKRTGKFTIGKWRERGRRWLREHYGEKNP